ncbi:MAG: PBP1A family penicillin-binding protein [candidate division KSB1 bacterium]|jgi:penicillin-binding protein 1A|nr:PBP1A family penicillin-binding protein [candidate division KSB1 bacterium]
MKSLIKKITLVIVFLLFAVFLFFAFRTIRSLPQLPEHLDDILLSSPTEIYSDNGELVSVLHNRQPVQYENISNHFINAVVAMEDAQFFNHHGWNKRGILRSLLLNLRRGRIVAGGSSISQQLAKNLFFSFERSWNRKIKEMLVAVQMERRYSKKELLESYCNQIYFGSNAYGIELASQTYFAKHADELNLAEAAFLANLPNWPSRYNPYIDSTLVKTRQEVVLNRMVETGYITQDDMNEAIEMPLRLQRLNQLWGKASYYEDYIKTRVEATYGKDILYYGGLKIYTSLDTRLQTFAYDALQRGLEELDLEMGRTPFELASTENKQKYVQAALVAIDPKTGKVKAMIGGRDFRTGPFNRAISARRQPGSAFKPFVYLTAINRGIANPATVYIDEPVTFRFDNQVYSPRNFDKRYHGPMILKKALAKSVNVVAIKLIDKAGPENVVDIAHSLGISSELNPALSLALGTSDVTPLEMASAYCAFANRGIHYEPLFITRIENSRGVQLEERTSDSKRPVDEQSIYLLVDMLKSVIRQGTGVRVQGMGFNRPCAGKTGTSDDSRDAWFVGFTPQLVTAVWVGYDDSQPLRDRNSMEITGGRGAIPIWVYFMEKALRNMRYDDFSIPQGIVFRNVDSSTGEISSNNAQNSMQVALRAGTKLPDAN